MHHWSALTNIAFISTVFVVGVAAVALTIAATITANNYNTNTAIAVLYYDPQPCKKDIAIGNILKYMYVLKPNNFQISS